MGMITRRSFLKGLAALLGLSLIGEVPVVPSETVVTLPEAVAGSDLTSIYVVNWGPNACRIIYPANSDRGIIDARISEAKHRGLM